MPLNIFPSWCKQSEQYSIFKANTEPKRLGINQFGVDLLYFQKHKEIGASNFLAFELSIIELGW